MQLKEIDLPTELRKIKEMGWIKSLRKSDTGIGKTIETLLGIPENNDGEPDCLYNGQKVEIKSHRSNSTSMITLFTLEPSIKNLKDVPLMEKYGYINGKGRKALKVTLKPDEFIAQGLKIKIDHQRDTISIVDKDDNEPWVWNRSEFHLKVHNICIIFSQSRMIDNIEEFRLDFAEMLSGLDEKCFFDLLEKGIVKIDLRMHINSKGGSRNRGTGFRILNRSLLFDCYQKKERFL